MATKMKWGIAVIAIVVIGAVAWKMSPGLRTKAVDAVGKVGGWSEEARKADLLG